MRAWFLIFIFFINPVFGQEEQESFWSPYVKTDIERLELIPFDSIQHEKAFRIWNSYQVVELIQYNDTVFSGQLINFANRVNRKEEYKETICQKIKISEETVQKLIEKLTNENIETLPDSYEVDGYVNGLDGTTIVFEISSELGKRIYSYWEPDNDHYQNPEIIEVKHVRSILNTIDSEFDLWKQFVFFRDKLPEGTYSYGGIIMQKL